MMFLCCLPGKRQKLVVAKLISVFKTQLFDE